MSLFMMGIGVFGLMIAIVLSWISSTRLYQPIRRIVNFVKIRPYDLHYPDDTDEIVYIERQWQHLNRESKSN